MLVTNVVLFIFAVCSVTASIAISTGTSVATSIRSRRGVVYSNLETRNNQDPIRGVQTTPRVSLQDIKSPHYRSVKASDTQKVSYTSPNHSGAHAYGIIPAKRPLPYGSTSVQQTEPHRKNPLVPYFDTSSNPNTYRAATSAEKPLDATKLIVSPSLSKLQSVYSPTYNSFHQDKSIELAGYADFEYPSYTGISKLISDDFQHQGAASPALQVPVYKTSYPLPKVGNYAYAPSGATLLQSSDKLIPAAAKQKDEATVDVNGKKISVPVIQIQSNADFDGALPVFESQPFLLSTSYPAESDLGFNFGPAPKLNLTPQSKNASPFLSPLSSFQGQVVPIQTAGGNSQFPQYKGASIEVYPVPSNLPKAQSSYESLYSQPQLHFGKEHGSQPINMQQNTVQSSISTEDILDDVEIINKKNPEPHTPQPDDNDEEDERYKNREKEYENSSEDDGSERQSGKQFKEPPTESDFKPSTSFPFKEYDEKFGKYRAQIDDEDSEDKPYSSYKNYSSNDDGEEDESSSEDHAEYVKSSKPLRDSYEEEDEDEEETRKHERQEESDDDSYQVEPKRVKYYGKDFEQEFEESYRKELPKHKYVHVKEVPQIDSYNNPKSSKRQRKDDNRPRINHEQEDSNDHGSRVSHRNRKTPRTGHRDNAAYGTNVSANKTPRVIYEEFFGYKDPETGRYTKHAKTESIAIEKYLPAKKSSKENSYLRAAKYQKLKSPKIGDGLAYKNNPYIYLSWKSGKALPVETLPGSNDIRQLSVPGDGASFYGTNVVNGQAHSLTNTEILRDLTGI